MIAAPSITTLRADVRAAICAAGAPRHVIVLAIDGVPYALGAQAWPRAQVSERRSVFPTTSATAWLSSLTGASVDAHGVPGVVFAVEPGAAPIDVYRYQGSLGPPPPDDLFSDAARAGYAPVAILGDLEDTPGAWRDLLVHRAQPVSGHRFFWEPGAGGAPAAISARVGAAVDAALAAQPGPALVWCFVDADHHIHRAGYDAPLCGFLAQLDALAAAWAARGALVIAHADHGLVPTRHDPAIAATIAQVVAAYGGALGGAGRTRWLDVAPDREADARAALRAALPASVEIRDADELFAPGSRARARVGAIVLIAGGEAFVAPDGYAYEHGSLTEAELAVPLAVWSPC